MKFENKQPSPEEIKVHAQKQIEKQHKLIQSLTPYKGHTLFEINCTTGEIVEPEYEVEAIDFIAAAKGNIAKRRKVIIKENCLYVSCLNKTNARKKYLDWVFKNIKEQKIKK